VKDNTGKESALKGKDQGLTGKYLETYSRESNQNQGLFPSPGQLTKGISELRETGNSHASPIIPLFKWRCLLWSLSLGFLLVSFGEGISVISI
jgi:hypothetical protein